MIPSKYNSVKNPVGIVEHTNFYTEKTAINGTVHSMLNFFQAFEFKSIFGIDAALNDSSDFEPRYYIDASDNRANAVTTRRNEMDYTIVLENTLYYKTDFFANHSLRLAAGTYSDDRQWDRELTQKHSTQENDPALRQPGATTGLNPQVKGLAGGNSQASFFGRAEYDFANKYLLTGTFRRYASSNFTPDKSWVSFPSLAGAWKISQEPFMKSLTFIESLKLRAGWGRTGNQEIPDYLFTPTTSGSQNYPLGNISNPGTTFLSSGNPQISWEVQSVTDAGLDISAFGGRVALQTDVFVKKTEDMLVRPTTPFIAGMQTWPMVNRGSLENRGMELALIYREKLGGFTSNIGLNFASYKNKILSLGQNNAVIIDAPFKNSGMVTRTETGHPIGSFYGYKTNGLFQTWEEVNSFTYIDPRDNTAKLVQENAAPGDIRYRDDDNDGKLDRGYIGSPHPKFTMGIHLDLKYHRFDLSLSFLGVYGNEIFNGTRWNIENGTAYTNLSVRMLDRWTGPNSTNDVNMPRMNIRDANNLRISDRFIEDGSFWRLKTLQLGYSFGGAFRNKIKFKKCRIFAGAANLLTFTAYSGLEPEISPLSGGVDRGTYPHARTYMAGLNIGL